MKSIKFEAVRIGFIDEVISVRIEVINGFTGEYCEETGFATYVNETSSTLALLRATRKVLKGMIKQFEEFIAKPRVNPTEQYYRKCVKEVLEIQKELCEVDQAIEQLM